MSVDKKHILDNIKFLSRFYTEEDITIYYKAHEDELESLIKAGFALIQISGHEINMVMKGVDASRAISFLLSADSECAKCEHSLLCYSKIIKDNTEAKVILI